MSDTIIGISVLQPVWIRGIYRLWFKARKASGEVSQGHIFIKEKSSINLPDQMPNWPEGTNTIWKFTKRGVSYIDCEPSVNWVSWGFHNGFNWYTAYVEMAIRELEPPTTWQDDIPESPRYHHGSAVHHDLNCTQLVEDSTRLITELKQEGILI